MSNIHRIYHGSEYIIGKPIYGKGKPYNDYGLGFYCTENKGMAKEWAVDQHRGGYVNIYDIDCTGLKVLNLNNERYTILHWLTILLQNRKFNVAYGLAYEAKKYLLSNFNINYTDADIIIGYRADDSYFSFAKDFLNGSISYRQLKNAMYLGKLGQQFVLKSPYAFERVIPYDVEYVSNTEWYEKKKRRDDSARKEYRTLEKNRFHQGDIYILNILQERMLPNDKRLQ